MSHENQETKIREMANEKEEKQGRLESVWMQLKEKNQSEPK